MTTFIELRLSLLQNCAREHSAANAASARAPKSAKAAFEQSEKFHASTSQNPHFLSKILWLSFFHLKDLAKIFLLTRFEKRLMTFPSLKNRW